MLSNNHVLANTNKAQKGDVIIQPGGQDGGEKDKHNIGLLEEFVCLQNNAINLVDAALATVKRTDVENPCTLSKDISLLGSYNEEQFENALDNPQDLIVVKIGRSSDITRGKIISTEMDNILVPYNDSDLNNCIFNNLISI